jgi:uncharacterized protein involved in exopolysaccharide biosynthesis
MDEKFTLEDALIMIRRRIAFFVIPAVAVAVAGLATVMLLPPMYSAEGKILIESRQIPEELVQSTVQAIAQERIQMIQQRVMTRNRLLEVADKYALFPKEAGLTESERVEQMRSAINVRVISASVSNRRKNQDGGAIAFTLSYTDRSPEKAFQVANEFMTLFLSEDVRARSSGAAQTTEFLKQETKRLGGAIDETENRIAEFKAKNADALPENLELHRQTLLRATQELTALTASIAQTEEQVRGLETQLTSYLAGSAGQGPSQQLAALKTQLAGLLADKTESHPDVRALRSQISSLERQLAPSGAVQALRRSVQQSEASLKEARAASPVDDAKVADLTLALASARQRLSAQISKEAAARGGDFLSAQIISQVDAANTRLTTQREQSEAAKTTIATMEDRIARTPAVERALLGLTRDQQNLINQYQALLGKQTTAQLSENLEDEQKGEKLSILEAARRPDKPSSPNRGQLSFLVLVAALGAGAAVALGMEALFATVRGREHIMSLTKEPPIAIIPYIRAAEEPRFPAINPFARKSAA